MALVVVTVTLLRTLRSMRAVVQGLDRVGDGASKLAYTTFANPG